MGRTGPLNPQLIIYIHIHDANGTGLGCTPPPAAYFSIRSYVAFRFKPSVWFPAAELGDPANHLTLNTTGNSNNQNGAAAAAAEEEEEEEENDPFHKTTLLMSTGDRETVGHDDDNRRLTERIG